MDSPQYAFPGLRVIILEKLILDTDIRKLPPVIVFYKETPVILMELDFDDQQPIQGSGNGTCLQGGYPFCNERLPAALFVKKQWNYNQFTMI